MWGHDTCSRGAVAVVVVGGSVDAWRGRGQAVSPIRHHVVAVVHHRCTGEQRSKVNKLLQLLPSIWTNGSAHSRSAEYWIGGAVGGCCSTAVGACSTGTVSVATPPAGEATPPFLSCLAFSTSAARGWSGSITFRG